MKFTLGWLREHLDTDAPLERITDTLTAIGLELEGVEDPGASLAPFRVAHVVEAERHPNADRLRACKVDAGSGVVSVVCGAPNARAGMKAVFAPPGSTIPGTGTVLRSMRPRPLLAVPEWQQSKTTSTLRAGMARSASVNSSPEIAVRASSAPESAAPPPASCARSGTGASASPWTTSAPATPR